MWIDICVHAWHYLPKGYHTKQIAEDDFVHLLYYSIFAFGVPLILVILAYLNKFGGLPSYYLKGTTKGAFLFFSFDEEEKSQRCHLYNV